MKSKLFLLVLAMIWSITSSAQLVGDPTDYTYNGERYFRVNKIAYHIVSDSTVKVEDWSDYWRKKHEGDITPDPYPWDTLQTPSTIRDTTIYPYVVRGDIVIPEQVQYKSNMYKIVDFEDRAFDNDSITSLTIPKSVVNITGDMLACFCPLLRKVNMPNSLRSIGKFAFTNSYHLSLPIRFPDSLRVIGSGAYLGTYPLDSIILPSKLEKIGSNTFGYNANYSWSTYKPSIFVHINGNLKWMEYDSFSFNTDNLIVVSDMRTLPKMKLEVIENKENSQEFFRIREKGRKVLFVPDECVDMYKSDFWWSQFDAIYPISEYKERTAIKEVKSARQKCGKQTIYTASGMPVEEVRGKGLYIIKEQDGTVQKVLKK